MNVTPLEIRQKVFEKAFRGYDKEEVAAFLNSLSIEWEKLNDQSKELKYKLEASEKEVQKLREVENSLFKTLKTAEDTGANMIEQATKTAELHMKETEMNADALMSEAKSRAKSIIEDAENRAKMIVDDMEDEIRQLEQVYRGLDANKVSLMSELRNLTNDIIGKLERHNDFPTDIKPHLKKAKELSREVNDSNTQDEAVRTMLKKPVTEPEETSETPDLQASDEAIAPEETPESEGHTENNAEKAKDASASEEEDAEEKDKGSFFDQFN